MSKVSHKESLNRRQERIAETFYMLAAIIYGAIGLSLIVQLVRSGLHYARIANSISALENVWGFWDGYWVVDRIHDYLACSEGICNWDQYPGNKVRPMNLIEIESFELKRYYTSISALCILSVPFLVIALFWIGRKIFESRCMSEIIDLPSSQLANCCAFDGTSSQVYELNL